MTKLPHILIMSSWYPTQTNPFLGNFVKRHAELIATKYPVSVLNLESNSALTEVSVEVIKTGNLTEVFIEYPSSANPFIQWKRARNAFKMGVKHIQHVDLIHASNILSKGYQFLWAKKHYQKPLIITEHGSYYRPEVSTNWSFKEKYILKNTFQKAATITAVSSFLKAEIECLFPKIEVQILPNVIDHSIFKYKEKETSSKVKFIHISTLDERFKNISGILEACEVLSREMNENRFELQIISDEPHQRWKEIVAQKELQDYIRFAGPMKPIEIAREIQEATALILFSNYETFSIVVAEAWATGTPVISTPVGIARDLSIDVGLQVEIQNTSSLVQAMKKFIELETNFNGSQIQHHSEAYTAANVLALIDELYASVLK